MSISAVKYNRTGLFWCMIFSLSLSLGKAQQASNFVYKAPPAALIGTSAKRTSKLQLGTLMRSAFDATNLLPPNYVKDGSVDYTQYLQKALNSNASVLMPDFPVLVNQSGLVIPNNSVIIFNRHSSIVMAPNNLANYAILNIRQVKNVTLYDPVIIGERKNHIGTKGEWGMGISILGASNVTIYNPNISNCWGDGMYIADLGDMHAENINIYNARLDFNRRNGISVISGKNLKIINPVITNTAGTMPMSGIDIEPDGSQDSVEGIDIEHPITFNSGGSGIQIGLSKLVGQTQKNVNININNYVDERSPMGLYVGGYNDHYDNGQPLQGQIHISNSTLIDNPVPFFGNSNYEMGPDTKITNMSVMKRGRNGKLLRDTGAVNKVKGKFSATRKLNFD